MVATALSGTDSNHGPPEAYPIEAPAPKPAQQPDLHHVRYHALDALRAIMMLLGLVLHTATSYAVTPFSDAWPFKDAHTSYVFDFFIFFVHGFRMPVFFVMAGFFAALLLEKRGLKSLMQNRFLRIGVPLVVGWIILQPLIHYGFMFAISRGSVSPETIPLSVRKPIPYENGSLMHLWFLYQLLILYVAAAGLVGVYHMLSHSVRERIRKVGAWICRSRLRILWLSLPAFGCLFWMPFGALETSTSFLPALPGLLFYGVFFGFGWMLFFSRQEVPKLIHGAWWKVLAAVVIFFPINFVCVVAQIKQLSPENVVNHEIPQVDWLLHTLAAASGALMTCLLMLGITGLFQRYLDRHSHTLRYLTDASYWLYLAHLPVMIWLAGVLAPYDLPAVAKAALVLLIGTPILLGSYHFLVRPTFIGLTLNGRRYPIFGHPAASAGNESLKIEAKSATVNPAAD